MITLIVAYLINFSNATYSKLPDSNVGVVTKTKVENRGSGRRK